MKKINYGIDAPKLIRNLLIVGMSLLIYSILSTGLFPPVIYFLHPSAIASSIGFLGTGLLMYAYSKFGKLKHRDRILKLYDWKGNEQILDVGTGSGLLMIGAAKKLTTGRAFGIDIFSTCDLSCNSIEQTTTNAELENVIDRVEILTENVLKTSFADSYFDVIVSNLCLHNLYKKQDRQQACREIFRILKPNGRVILSDFKKINEYRDTFEKLGMSVKKTGTYFFDTFPPLTIIIATKLHLKTVERTE